MKLVFQYSFVEKFDIIFDHVFTSDYLNFQYRLMYKFDICGAMQYLFFKKMNTDILVGMQQTWGNHASSKRTIFPWVVYFKRGDMSLEDEILREFFGRFVTVHETWYHYYMPDLKWQFSSVGIVTVFRQRRPIRFRRWEGQRPRHFIIRTGHF